jgi:hypothetical protein
MEPRADANALLLNSADLHTTCYEDKATHHHTSDSETLTHTLALTPATPFIHCSCPNMTNRNQAAQATRRLILEANTLCLYHVVRNILIAGAEHELQTLREHPLHLPRQYALHLLTIAHLQCSETLQVQYRSFQILVQQCNVFTRRTVSATYATSDIHVPQAPRIQYLGKRHHSRLVRVPFFALSVLHQGLGKPPGFCAALNRETWNRDVTEV